MSELSLDSITIDGAGPGPALVLLHAFPLDHRVWLPCARLLTDHVSQIILFDLPGHGRSELPAELGLEYAAQAVNHRVREMGHDDVVLAGLSMGGYVALACAQLEPSLPSGLALVDSKTSPDDAAGARKRHDLAEALTSEGIEAVIGAVPGLLAPAPQGQEAEHAEQVRAWIREQDPAGVAWSALSMAQRPDRGEVVTSASFPVSFIAGSEDAITPLTAAQEEFGQLAHVTTHSIDGAGHLSALEAPAQVAQELIALLTRARSGRGHQRY